MLKALLRAALAALVAGFLLEPMALAVSGMDTITTVAGGGREGFSGDGGPARAAKLRGPDGIALDRAGNLYIADWGNHRVRKVSAAGIITTVAGTRRKGFSGDGGPASSARLNGPHDVALDQAGNLYIADSGNERVRKVSRAGIITTVAGTGRAGFSGDGRPASSAQLFGPHDVAFAEDGALYIVDLERVRRVSAAGIITTIAGTGTFGLAGDGGPASAAQLRLPSAVALDRAGNLYIADTGNERVRKVNPAGIITTVAGGGSAGLGDGGPATSARLNSPRGVALDRAGSLYIADSNRVRKVTRYVRDAQGNSTVFLAYADSTPNPDDHHPARRDTPAPGPFSSARERPIGEAHATVVKPARADS